MMTKDPARICTHCQAAYNSDPDTSDDGVCSDRCAVALDTKKYRELIDGAIGKINAGVLGASLSIPNIKQCKQCGDLLDPNNKFGQGFCGGTCAKRARFPYLWLTASQIEEQTKMQKTCVNCGKIVLPGFGLDICGPNFCDAKCQKLFREQAKASIFNGSTVPVPTQDTVYTEFEKQAIGHVDQSKSKPVKLCLCGKTFDSPNPHATFCSHMCAANAAASYKTADRALRFLAGLNLQDHPVKEQREAVDIVRALVKVLKPEAK